MSYVTKFYIVYDILYDIVYDIIKPFPGFSDSVRAPSSAGGQPDDTLIVWNTDDERDYSDHEYSPPSPMAHYPPYPGPREPLARFMADLPDLYDFDKLALNEALRGLHVPDYRPAPQGISLEDTIKVHCI